MEEEQLQLDPETEQAWAEGRVELISQESAKEALERIQRYQRLARKHPSRVRRIAEYQHWIEYLSALGKYYFHPSIVRIRELIADEEKGLQQQQKKHHARPEGHARDRASRGNREPEKTAH
jgi:hypothetical protein